MRFNIDAEEVELVVDGKVAISSGKDVFESWVSAYNEKHKPVEKPVEEKKVDTSVEEVKSVEEPVDNDKEE